MGELCLSPVGLSAMSTARAGAHRGAGDGRLVPGAAVGNYLAGMAASVYETMPLPTLFGVRHGHRRGGRGGAGAPDQADPTDAGAVTA